LDVLEGYQVKGEEGGETLKRTEPSLFQKEEGKVGV